MSSDTEIHLAYVQVAGFLAVYRGGGNKEEREWKRQEKESAYQAQLDVLKRRKSGAWQKVPLSIPLTSV